MGKYWKEPNFILNSFLSPHYYKNKKLGKINLVCKNPWPSFCWTEDLMAPIFSLTWVHNKGLKLSKKTLSRPLPKSNIWSYFSRCTFSYFFKCVVTSNVGESKVVSGAMWQQNCIHHICPKAEPMYIISLQKIDQINHKPVWRCRLWRFWNEMRESNLSDFLS